jgi:signal transduction histidine kinase
VDACRFDTTEGKDHHVIDLRCRRDVAGNTVLEVSDDGIGVPEEVKDKVFEDFFSTKGNEGTGLGLLVARKIVEEHGGNITFTSEPNRGTTFGVVLPPGGAVKEE